MGKNWIVTKVNQNYILRSGIKKFKCQVGAGGLKIHSKKREGDKATPIGKWKLKSIFYRSDKIFKSIIKPNTVKINNTSKGFLLVVILHYLCWYHQEKGTLFQNYTTNN